MKLAGSSTSVTFNLPEAVGLLRLLLFVPPASTTFPEVSPVIIAASLLPVMVMVMICSVPSSVLTVKVSSKVSPTFNP